MADRGAFIRGFGAEDEDDTGLHFIDRYIPMPESIGDGWYDWCLNNWGTKWADCDTRIITDDSEETIVVFNTAWGPPQSAIETISGMFPSLTFHLSHNEPGMCFMGIDVYLKGDVAASWEIHHDRYPSMGSVEDDAWEAHLEAVESMFVMGNKMIDIQRNWGREISL